MSSSTDKPTLKRNLEADNDTAQSTKSKKVDTKGVAQIKPEYILEKESNKPTTQDNTFTNNVNKDEDDVEEESLNDRLSSNLGASSFKKKKKRGQNKNRDNRQKMEEFRLCPRFIQGSGDGTVVCPFGTGCRFIHDIDFYMKNKSPDIEVEVFKICPVFERLGYCPMGMKCRFLQTHFDKTTNNLLTDNEIDSAHEKEHNHELNHITGDQKLQLIKRKFKFVKSEHILEVIDAFQQEFRDSMNNSENEPAINDKNQKRREHQKEIYLKYKDTRYFSQEKKPLNLRNKKILSPLTTVGNLPYRRLMRSLGCDVTYSEMALCTPLIQGTNSEWALPKAHCTEYPGFGVQIACSKPWQAAKACEALSTFISNGLSEINLNSGCPIDLLYRQGAGSALLDNPAKMIRCLNAMNYCSGEIPTSVKIRMGCKDDHPIAKPLVRRLVLETDVRGITLHGRSRQQRYTKLANWDYVGEVANEVRMAEVEREEKDIDYREHKYRVQFIGNGDISNYEEWYDHMAKYGDSLDSCMVARAALIKPWIFEEIDAQQHLDKTSKERLDILETYARFSMDHWGTDEYGISQCRRFFLEFMSFFHRYIPIGICEKVPVKLNERPPHWKGRDDLETLLGSTDYKDWITVSEMFFGKTPESFIFTPKHKSNSYEN
ncbi:tRNA dihydrouridine synthase DUS3 SCDLUD_004269 [Saccharomycodes ludwigii]|uniref:tRNA dihydrouridine synthase DUS3 n=1 Tax=Saccharomycodes ludwigii TaxID=36035 RepID=UPI001E82E237|nr:hypothetical protein SCDLUD_004269 [Saccharomycodes ludwigii]KAH3899953.1 hypothetical protein SCDLUD_004269 [Saccharomycodes ludwigii]